MESNRRLSHQSSNGDLHHVNHKENHEPSSAETHIVHNMEGQKHTRHNGTIQKQSDNRTVCGLRHELLKPTLVMCSWFVCSFMTIMLNKYILSSLDADPGILGEFQIVITTILGFIAMHLPCKVFRKAKETHSENYNKAAFFKSMIILGFLRFGSVVCSVVAMKNVAISFSETIKSSAPLFTVIIAYIILGEYSGLYVNLSLLPIMFGLAICTSNELSFVLTGFFSALLNNILDCPMELQFYTSIAATLVQLPFWLFFLDVSEKIEGIDQYLIGILLFNSVLFYFQSFTAYLLMSLISPITFSVASTAKRAVLIWFSVLVFGNSITILSGVGTAFVVVGVFFYHRARHKETVERMRQISERDMRELNI